MFHGMPIVLIRDEVIVSDLAFSRELSVAGVNPE
jgi:hypothetical protein